jgi:hypothetical protein
MITAREYFAANAIGPIYSDLMRNSPLDVDFDVIARLAFAMADKMLQQSSASEEKSENFQFAGWANLYSCGQIGIILKNKDELPAGCDEEKNSHPQAVKVYIEYDRT